MPPNLPKFWSEGTPILQNQSNLEYIRNRSDALLFDHFHFILLLKLGRNDLILRLSFDDYVSCCINVNIEEIWLILISLIFIHFYPHVSDGVDVRRIVLKSIIYDFVVNEYWSQKNMWCYLRKRCCSSKKDMLLR